MSGRPLSQIPAVDAYPTLVSAYRHDPVHRWLYPDDGTYANRMPALIDAVAGAAFEMRTAWRISEDSAVALWVPPGVEPDPERIGTVLLQTVDEAKHAEMFSTLEQTDAARPDYPHWYLPFLGVESGKQGEGHGSRLMSTTLEYIDLGGLPAYLLAPNPRNIAFFERFGFVHLRDVQDGSAPALAVMTRKGRGS